MELVLRGRTHPFLFPFILKKTIKGCCEMKTFIVTACLVVGLSVVSFTGVAGAESDENIYPNGMPHQH